MTVHFTPPAVLIDGKIDSRLAFLARAAARLELVNAGAMDLDEAFDGLVVSISCDCSRETVQRWERAFPDRPRLKPKPRQRAAQSTLDALVCELRTRGIAQLEKANCRRRLGDLSTDQAKQLVGVLLRLRPNYPAITDELILKLGELT